MRNRNAENINRWMHEAVVYERGKAWKCEFCGKTGTGKQVQWANKYHTVTFFVEDYIQLCAKCHYEFDNPAIQENQKNGIFMCVKTNSVFTQTAY